jgi:hypothetical protein
MNPGRSAAPPATAAAPAAWGPEEAVRCGGCIGACHCREGSSARAQAPRPRTPSWSLATPPPPALGRLRCPNPRREESQSSTYRPPVSAARVLARHKQGCGGWRVPRATAHVPVANGADGLAGGVRQRTVAKQRHRGRRHAQHSQQIDPTPQIASPMTGNAALPPPHPSRHHLSPPKNPKQTSVEGHAAVPIRASRSDLPFQ